MSQSPEVFLIINDEPLVGCDVASKKELLPGVLPLMRTTAQEKGGSLAVIATVHGYNPDDIGSSVFLVNPDDTRHFVDGSFEPLDFLLPAGAKAIPTIVTGEMVSKFGTPPDGSSRGIEWRDVLPAVVQSQISA